MALSLKEALEEASKWKASSEELDARLAEVRLSPPRQCTNPPPQITLSWPRQACREAHERGLERGQREAWLPTPTLTVALTFDPNPPPDANRGADADWRRDSRPRRRPWSSIASISKRRFPPLSACCCPNAHSLTRCTLPSLTPIRIILTLLLTLNAMHRPQAKVLREQLQEERTQA